MTDVEDAMHLRLDLRHVGEVGILPRNDMARRRLETALSHAVNPASSAVWRLLAARELGTLGDIKVAEIGMALAGKRGRQVLHGFRRFQRRHRFLLSFAWTTKNCSPPADTPPAAFHRLLWLATRGLSTSLE